MTTRSTEKNRNLENKASNMKKKLLLAAAVVAASVIGATVQADPISGTTGFTGSFTAANNNLTTANDLITISTASLNGIPTGSFVGGVLTGFTPSITLNGPGGNPVITSQPVWTVTVGVHVYKFTSTSDSTVTDLANINTIVGSGTVLDTSDGDTANGSYNLSFTDTVAGGGVTLTWAGTTGATPPVPDSGMTLLLLGMGLAALGVFAVSRKQVLA